MARRSLDRLGTSAVIVVVVGLCSVLLALGSAPSMRRDPAAVQLTTGLEALSTPRALVEEPPPGGVVNSVEGFGRLSGRFSVSGDGAARYRLPLWMPRGRGDAAPALTLSYSSRGGEGPFGVGWSLGGLSSITWCPRTIAQDGYTDGLHTDGTSALCLDGNRLLPVSAPFSPVQEYRTQHATFARIVGYETQDNVPNFFRVWSKDGRVLTFGETAHSRLEAYPLQASPDLENPSLVRASERRETLAWGLNRVEDRNGNAATVTYRRAEGSEADLWWGQMLPATVAFAPNRRVEFHYEPRPDPIDRFTHGGLHTRIDMRTSSIEMWAGPENGPAELLRRYDLSYRNGSVTRRSLLYMVSECDHNGACKRPLRFDSSMGQNRFKQVRIGGHPGGGWSTIQIADINGDGRSDLVHRPNAWLTSVFEPGQTLVSRSETNGFAAPEISYPDYRVGWDRDTGLPLLRIADLDADGRSDMVALVPDGPTETLLDTEWRWRLFKSNGNILVPAHPSRIGKLAGAGQARIDYRDYFADLNGDGLTDFVEVNVGSDGGPWHYRFNTGRQPVLFGKTKVSAIPRGSTSKKNFVMDADGDGRAELLAPSSTGFGYDSWGLSAATEQVAATEQIGVVNLARGDGPPSFGDVNGDGLDDQVLITSEREGTPGLTALINSGTGFSERPSVSLPGGLPGNDVLRSRLRIVDFDHDGRDDVLLFYGGRASGPEDQTHGVQLYRWTDTGFVRESQSIRLDGMSSCDQPDAATNGCNWSGTQPLDFDADGLLDFVHFTPDSTQAWLFVRRGGIPDLLVGIGDGLGQPRVMIDYTNLADRSIHTPGRRKACGYPLVCPASGGSIVASHRLATGVGTGAAWDRYDHQYRSARVDLRGHGWLGFAEHSVARPSTGEETVTQFDNTTRVGAPTAEYSGVVVYPYASVPKSIETRGFDQPAIAFRRHRRTVTYDNAFRQYEDGSFSVEQRTITQTEDETGYVGSGWQQLKRTTTNITYDEFGNKVLVVSATQGGRRLTENVDYRDETSSRFGRPGSRLVTACTTSNVCSTRESTFDYDDNGNPKVVVVEPNRPKLKLTTTATYGPFGVVTSITRADAAGHSRAANYEYDADYLYPTAIINARGHRTLIDTHSGLGVPLRTTDPNGVPMTMRYDWFGRRREANYADGNFEHVQPGITLLTGAEYVTTAIAGGGSTTVVFDRFDREIEWRVNSFDGRTATAYTHYDTLGRADRVSRPSMPDEEAQYTRFESDLRGRVTSVTAPDGAQIRHEYQGAATTTYDAKGTASYTKTKVDGQVRARFEDDPSNFTQWLETRLSYGPFGELTNLVAPDNTMQSAKYDSLGRREQLHDPSSGTSITTYNAFGEVATVTDAENRTTTFQYDSLGRVKRTTSPDGVATNTWDTADYGLGKLAEARSADGITTSYTYNELGQIVTATWTIEETRYEYNYNYDNVGRLSCITYPVIPGADPHAANRLAVGYLYNPHGYLARVTEGCQGDVQTYWVATARTGQMERERAGNGVVTTRAYDPVTGLLNRIITRGPGTVGKLGEIAYTYDANRNVTRRNDLVHQRDEAFAYDVLDRLTGWSIQSTDSTPGLTANYTYDAVGNLKTATVQPANQPEDSETYHYGQEGASPHALTALDDKKYRYDGAGQQIKGPNRTVQYNTLGLPTVLHWGIGQGQVRRTDFAYDSDGARALKRDSEQTSITVAGLFERHTPAGTGFRQIHNLHNIVVNGRVIAQVNWVQAASGGHVKWSRTTYLHTDLQGSTVALTDRNGRPSNDHARLREQFYDPFGRRITDQNEPLGGGNRGGPRQGYTGHEHDVEHGLINMKGRMYDPRTRRFLTPDPSLQNPLSSEGHNRYAYVRNNPTTLTDPTGWQACDPLAPSCSESDSGGEAGVISVVAAGAALVTDWLTGGGGEGEDYLYGSDVITSDGVDDDVAWDEKTTASQLAIEESSGAGEYHGIGGWLHQRWYEPAQEGYAAWVNMPDKLYSSWGGHVPVLGHAAGVVAGTVPWVAGQVGRLGVGVLQFLTPKTEEEHFLFVMSGGLAAATHPVSRIGARAPQFVEASVTSMRLDVEVYRGSKLLFSQTFWSGAGGNLGHAEMKAVALFNELKLLQSGDELFMYGAYDICGHGMCRSTLDSLARQMDVDILYYGFSREQGSRTFFGRGVGWIPMSKLDPN